MVKVMENPIKMDDLAPENQSLRIQLQYVLRKGLQYPYIPVLRMGLEPSILF